MISSETGFFYFLFYLNMNRLFVDELPPGGCKRNYLMFLSQNITSSYDRDYCFLLLTTKFSFELKTV